MWLIVGLGNPGSKYQGNRHNIGFWVIDELARRHHLGSFRDKFASQVASGRLAAEKVVVQKPMGFMNLSGHAVSRAAQFYGLESQQIIVAYDEIDLDMGRLKVKVGGGHGGHNGLRSIVEQLGTRDVIRVRLGVGKPAITSASAEARDRQISNYLLSDFPREQMAQAEELVGRAASAVETIVARGVTAAMNEYNSKETATEPT